MGFLLESLSNQGAFICLRLSPKGSKVTKLGFLGSIRQLENGTRLESGFPSVTPHPRFFYHETLYPGTPRLERHSPVGRSDRPIQYLCFFFIYTYFFFLIWTIFKVSFEFVTLLLLFHVLVFWPRGVWNPSSPTSNRTHTACFGRRTVNHWTAREVPHYLFLRCVAEVAYSEVGQKD